jgi:hypothetical protein
MITVHKYVFPWLHGFDIAIPLPKGAKILSVGNQAGSGLVLWAEVDTEKEF